MGERQHVGEGEGRSIAGTRLLADAGPVDDGDLLPGFGEESGGRDADDAGADDDDVGFQLRSFTVRSCPCPHDLPIAE